MTIFEIKRSPGKGFGMFAKKNLPRGTLYLTEQAAIVCPPESIAPFYDHRKLFAPLPQKIQDDFWSLTEGPDDSGMNKFLRIVRANSFGLTSAHAGYGASGVFSQASRINHSCVPNSDWEIKDQTITLYTSTAVKKGEELFIDYNFAEYSMLIARHRNNILRANYGFTCSCRACNGTEEEQQPSDMRRQLIGGLTNNVNGLKTPDFKLWDGERPHPRARHRAMESSPLDMPLSTKELVMKLLLLTMLYKAEGFSGCHIYNMYERIMSILSDEYFPHRFIIYPDYVELKTKLATDSLAMLRACRPSSYPMPEGLETTVQMQHMMGDVVITKLFRTWQQSPSELQRCIRGRPLGFAGDYPGFDGLKAVDLGNSRWKLNLITLKK